VYNFLVAVFDVVSDLSNWSLIFTGWETDGDTRERQKGVYALSLKINCHLSAMFVW